MATAKITLLHCESFTGRGGKKILKNASFMSSNAAEIRYFQGISEFSVEVMPEPKPAAPAPQPVAEESVGFDDDLDDLDDEGDEDDEDDEGEGEEVEGEDDDSPAAPTFTKTELSSQKKSALIELAADVFNLELADSMKKSVMIAKIMKAQIAALNAD